MKEHVRTLQVLHQIVGVLQLMAWIFSSQLIILHVASVSFERKMEENTVQKDC